MAEETKQEPERPKKRKTVLSLPVMIIIGVVVLALLIGGTLFAVNMMVSSIVETKLSGADSTGSKGGDHAKVEKTRSPEDAAMAELEEQEFLGEVPTIYFETGRIITNPRGSSRFLVLNLGLEYREKVSEEGGGEEAKKEEGMSPEKQRLLAKIKDIINSKLGSMTESELETNTDSLRIFIKNDLSLLFKKEKKFLKDVLFVEKIIQ